MRKMNYIRHLIIYLFILIIFLCSFLYPFPSDIDQAAETSFSFEVTNPTINENLNNKNVQFSGTYTLDTNTDPNAKLSVTITDNTDPENPVIFPSDTMIISDNSWSFSKDFTDGPHSVTFAATDGTTAPIQKSVSFNIDTVRPSISNGNYKLISTVNGTTLETPIEDMTHVPLDAKIQITVKETNSLEFKDNGGTYTPIIVKSENQINITSVEDWSTPPQRDATTGDYILTFTPSPSTPLEPGMTYYVYITTDIVDESGNSVYPKVLKFTTTSDNEKNNPHGDYALNDPQNGVNRTNLCANCHSTHVGASKGLLGGNFINDKTKSPVEQDNTVNYCMACHDGTTATRVETGETMRIASKVDNMDVSTGSKHDEFLDSKHLANQGSCSSCHDPHLLWTKDNPNMLKDHFVFDHTGVQDAPQEEIDSNTTLCENCHDNKTGTYEDSAGVTYDIYHYRKSTTRLGDISDNELCLRCHNADKVQKGEVQSDIKSLYIKTSSKHNFAALDGSNVTGPLPCAECHETHGSSNIKLLKSKLGQENQDSDFSVPSGGWNDDTEKQFCMKCHNGTTAVYGVVGKAVDDNHDLDPKDTNYPDPITTKHLACSKCHGGASQSFIEAAHAPQASTESPSP